MIVIVGIAAVVIVLVLGIVANFMYGLGRRDEARYWAEQRPWERRSEE